MKVQPVNQNIIVRRLTKAAEEKVGGIILPQGSTANDPTEVVEIVAVSPDIKPLNGTKLAAKAGSRALVHRGLNGTPITVNGETLLVLGYVNLIAVLS